MSTLYIHFWGILRQSYAIMSHNLGYKIQIIWYQVKIWNKATISKQLDSWYTHIIGKVSQSNNIKSFIWKNVEIQFWVVTWKMKRYS